MTRVLLLVAMVTALFATEACSKCDCPGTPENMPIASAQVASSPESEASSKTGDLTPPDADELVISTVSESELEASARHLSGVAPSVTAEGSSFVYSGTTNAEGFDTLMRLAEHGGTSELVISSPGGMVYWGQRSERLSA